MNKQRYSKNALMYLFIRSSPKIEDLTSSTGYNQIKWTQSIQHNLNVSIKCCSIESIYNLHLLECIYNASSSSYFLPMYNAMYNLLHNLKQTLSHVLSICKNFYTHICNTLFEVWSCSKEDLNLKVWFKKCLNEKIVGTSRKLK